jgi:hypothetical protein
MLYNTRMDKKFSSRALAKESYQLMKPQLWAIIGQYALVIGIQIILSIVFRHLFVMRMVVSVLSGFVLTFMSLSYAEHKSFVLEDLHSKLPLKKLWPYVLTMALYMLVVVGGMFLFILPGIIVAIQLSFVHYVIFDKDLSVMGNLKESVALTKGARWGIVRFLLLFTAINILGMMCFLVGTFFTFPLTQIAFALLYKKISSAGPEGASARGTTVVEEAATPSEPVAPAETAQAVAA